MSEYPVQRKTISVPLDEWNTTKEKLSQAERLLRDLLVGVDDFERAIGSAEREESYPAILKGLRTIQAALVQALGAQDVRRFRSVGEPFDPRRHELLEGEPPVDGGVVVEEMRPGYERGGAVFRRAWVRLGAASGS